jgi:hypothetical protein
MMIDEKKDVRWIQRFANFHKAFSQWTKFIDKAELSELEEQGLIKAFEYPFDLSLYHHIKQPDLIDHIQRVGKVFYSKRN